MKRLIAYFHTAANAPADRKYEGAARAASERGWTLLRFDIRSIAVAREEIRFWQPDGIIVDAVAASSRIINEPAFRDFPLVFIDGNPEIAPADAFCLFQDPDATAHAAAEELLRHPMESYAYAGWPGGPFWSVSRGKAFAKAMAEHGRDVREFALPGATPTRRSMVNRLAQWIAGLPRPVGIFTATDPLASQVLEAAESIGLHAPADIMVVGVDNDDTFCECAQPSISSVSIDFEGVGRRAVELVAMQMEDPKVHPVRESFANTKTVTRSTTRRSKRHDPAVTRALDFIRQHATDGITAADVIPLFSCSRRLAEQRFRAVAGRSILDEIHAIQVERAKRLISNPLQKLSAVPQLCGHASTPFFAKLFKTSTGMTMSEWRLRGN